MVAEPTLFLSADEKVQVRAHKTKKGLMVYCVRDFIRMIANKDLSPTNAMIYWMSASSSQALRTEHDIQDQYGVQFQGAYEPRSVCVTAAGLLMLLHYMDTKWSLVLEEYKSEVRDRLKILAEGNGAEFVWDYDDGEVDEMMAAKEAAQAQGKGLEAPPDDWKFFHEEKKDEPSAAAGEQLAECLDSVAAVMLEVGKQQLAEEAGSEAPKPGRDRKTAFMLKRLMAEMDLRIDRQFMPALGKAVSAKFRKLYPESETFIRHKTVFFFQEDRAALEELVREECSKFAVRRVDEDFEEGV